MKDIQTVKLDALATVIGGATHVNPMVKTFKAISNFLFPRLPHVGL